jgi:hypothetical protein
VGYYAGYTSQHANSIVLNATGAALNTAQASSFYVKPVRGGNIAASALAYTSAGEIVEETNVHFDTNGNVGIGTASPSSRLDVTELTNSKTTPALTLRRSGVFDYASPFPSVWRLLDIITTANGSDTRQCGINLLNYSLAGTGQNGIGDRLRTGLGFSVHNENGIVENALIISKDGRVGIGDTTPSYKLDVNGGIRTRLPHLWARQTSQPGATNSLLLVWNNTVYNDSTLGNMYSTTRTCNFPIKGVYVVTVQAHSYYAGGALYYTNFLWLHKNSGGGTRWTTRDNPKNLSENSANSDMHTTGTMVIVADAGDYLEVTHGTSISTSRNYSGDWNNIRAVCIYAIN